MENTIKEWELLEAMLEQLAGTTKFTNQNITERRATTIAHSLLSCARGGIQYVLMHTEEKEPFDWDWWYGISKNWDINIYLWGDDVKATIYPVTDPHNIDYANPISVGSESVLYKK